jgi:hypothetical protein
MRNLATKGLLLLSLMFSPLFFQAQSMSNMFLMLPAECTPGLNASGRTNLIKYHDYAIDTNDDKKEIDYSIDTITDGFLSYEYSKYGKNENYEIKKLKTAGDSYILLFTKDADVKKKSDKYVFKTYDVSGNTLKESSTSYIPVNLDYFTFLKPETPDSVKASIQKTSYCAFDLEMNSTYEITFRIVLRSVKDEKWLTGNSMVFQWNGTSFSNTITFQKEE